jgi:PiT family inorganic phosphate transporter
MQAVNFVMVVIFIAFIFEFINGFHDAANSIATIVSTGVLKPFTAVLWAAFFNFIAFAVFHLNVANTFGVGLVNPHEVTTYVIFSALLGAIVFNLITWYFALPSSSSHALIGGLMGAVLAKSGWNSLEVEGLTKTFIAILVSPVLGMLVSTSLLWLLNKVLKIRHKQFNRSFQLISSALLSLGHGSNDAQKTMGIIALLLYSSRSIEHFYVPFWVIISCSLVMGLGTLAGGFRIVKTMGEKITSLNPQTGAAAETGSAIVLFVATALGIPVSTTHIVTGSITGVGMQYSRFSTNWQTLKRITIAWLLTIPCAGLFSAIFVWMANW